MHTESHPLAGKTVHLNDSTKDPVRDMVVAGALFEIEDWWDRLTGASWQHARGNPACLQYAMRSGTNHGPIDDEVVYGKIGPWGHLVHVTELGEVMP